MVDDGTSSGWRRTAAWRCAVEQREARHSAALRAIRDRAWRDTAVGVLKLSAVAVAAAVVVRLAGY